MFKYISLFVCLFGVSLASSRSSEAESLLEAMKKHQQYLSVCGNELKNFKSCEALVEDLTELESIAESSISEALSAYEQGVALLADFTACSTKSIFKEVSCYESVMTSAKKLVVTVEEEATEIEEELMSAVSQIESDLSSCISSGYTSQVLNSKMAMCKLRLMLKN